MKVEKAVSGGGPEQAGEARGQRLEDAAREQGARIDAQEAAAQETLRAVEGVMGPSPPSQNRLDTPFCAMLTNRGLASLFSVRKQLIPGFRDLCEIRCGLRFAFL